MKTKREKQGQLQPEFGHAGHYVFAVFMPGGTGVPGDRGITSILFLEVFK